MARGLPPVPATVSDPALRSLLLALHGEVSRGTGATAPTPARAASTTPQASTGGAQGPAGPQGPQGPAGATGPAGVDGQAIHYGTGAPSSGLGADGDCYIDTAAYDLYAPKAGGVWPSGVSLVGPAGATGPTGATGPAGAAGSKWYSGTGAPSGGAYTVGDWYLDDANGDVYEKTGASAWTLRDNLTGPAGGGGGMSHPQIMARSVFGGPF